MQCSLPLTLVPIRVDLDIQPFRPEAPLPVPNNQAARYGIDENLPAYKRPEMSPAYRLKDHFLWNLHEALCTPDMFAKILVEDLDLPPDRKTDYVLRISSQIREQLEQYAGIALHPLFQPSSGAGALNASGAPAAPAVNGSSTPMASTGATPQIPPSTTQTPAASTPVPSNGNGVVDLEPPPTESAVTATASQPEDLPTIPDHYNPDDSYRCIISLSINLMNRLYTDRFEWSLLHPPGFAEQFARITCADLGLTPEWSSAIAHSIYEAVLRLKKEVCENGGVLGTGEIDNDCLYGAEAGWRYDVDQTGNAGERWEPKVEVLSKEEIEKREGDRERQLRRVRRETARFSTSNTLTPGEGFAGTPDHDAMGRGERRKTKRRFRSLSPLGRDSPDVGAGSGAYGGGGALGDDERKVWRCAHCAVWGTAVWAVRDGPRGAKVSLSFLPGGPRALANVGPAQSLCHNCGYLYERDKRLPPWTQGLFASETMRRPG